MKLFSAAYFSVNHIIIYVISLFTQVPNLGESWARYFQMSISFELLLRGAFHFFSFNFEAAKSKHIQYFYINAQT